MKKTRKIYLHNLRNEEWFNFFTEFKTIIEKFSPEKLKILKTFAVFSSLYILVDGIIEKIRKNRMTAQISELDKQRDTTFRGLVRTIDSYTYHFDMTKQAAAKNLDPVLSHYGNLADKPYNEETAGIYNFLQELRTNYVDEITVLEIAPWLDELEQKNNEFEKTILDRNQDEANKSELKLLDVRRDVDKAYTDIIERIEALLLLEEDENQKSLYETFLKELNTNIKRYTDIIAQRKGRKDSNSETNNYLS
jgi:short-subunit dehydrogenase involved in D-alanine esterification of teichoic acids